jgi:hypothetical protein
VTSQFSDRLAWEYPQAKRARLRLPDVDWQAYRQRMRTRVDKVDWDAAKQRVRDVYDGLPPDTAAELRKSALRLRKARSPRDAVAALEFEIETLFSSIAPTRVEHPLPLRTTRGAIVTVAVVAGSAAALDEMEAIALLIPGVQTAAVPTLPVILGAALVSLTLEAYVAASLRVHQLRAAGIEPDPKSVVHDVVQAMTGRADVKFTKFAAQALARRMLRRWARGIVPIVGIGWATWDARKTMLAIDAMPVRAESGVIDV